MGGDEQGFERRILLRSLLVALPALVLAVPLVWSAPWTTGARWTVLAVLVGLTLAFAFTLRDVVVYPLRVLANLLEALREGDYSLRARRASREDALGEVLLEANLLADTLKGQRLEALEATALLRRVMAEIDVAVFAFDGEGRLRLVNRAGERLLGGPERARLGQTAEDAGLAGLLDGPGVETLERVFPGGAGRWGVRRSWFREEGRPHRLLVVADLSAPLREEERVAWRRLMRVLGHELNNSLAPIRSLAGTLGRLLRRDPRPADWEDDAGHALNLIVDRVDSLGRFVGAYSQLARLPDPQPVPTDLGALVRRVAALETRLAVKVRPGAELVVPVDEAQIEQLLINLVRNAVDAARETSGGVTVTWRVRGEEAEVLVDDEGPGLSGSENLFVPFFTTKPGGSGIGLVLSRQIAEGHGGGIELTDRPGGRGCRARLFLPLTGAATPGAEPIAG